MLHTAEKCLMHQRSSEPSQLFVYDFPAVKLTESNTDKNHIFKLIIKDENNLTRSRIVFMKIPDIHRKHFIS